MKIVNDTSNPNTFAWAWLDNNNAYAEGPYSAEIQITAGIAIPISGNFSVCVATTSLWSDCA